jgi:hypothetical protein
MHHSYKQKTAYAGTRQKGLLHQNNFFGKKKFSLPGRLRWDGTIRSRSSEGIRHFHQVEKRDVPCPGKMPDSFAAGRKRSGLGSA